MNDHDMALEALRMVSPSRADDYHDWIRIGMALKKAGISCETWDQWSRSSSKYHAGACEKKWRTFDSERGFGTVSVGTLVHMAEEDGAIMRQKRYVGPVVELDWDSSIGGGSVAETPPLLLTPPDNWKKGLTDFLEALFKPSEIVAYNIKAQQDAKGKWIPEGFGTYTRTAGELTAAARKTDSADAVYYDRVTPAGAWIRINPFDGTGIHDANVTEYRHVLVESDLLPVERQYDIFRRLELPLAAIVHSGGKSLHGIVRIGAGKDLAEYRRRVDLLYKTLAGHGFAVDRQNRNPSRLSRLPGVERGDNPQWLIGTNFGKATWEEWEASLDELLDDLPDFEPLEDLAAMDLPLSPEIIEGVLREGHKMLLSGPSKAGKSFAMMHLALAIGNGSKWLGMQCRQGRTCYVNLEIDRASAVKRFKDLGAITHDSFQNIDLWNLRGKCQPLNLLAPRLIRRLRHGHYSAVIIDPIYKLLTGDENKAEDMAKFCNHLDSIATECGCAVVFATHFSKGEQGGKKAIDRTSGSGVFGRDPDAVMTMSELEEPHCYRIEATLREFATPDPINVRFEYPMHNIDTELHKAKIIGEAEQSKRGRGRPAAILAEDLIAGIEHCMAFDGGEEVHADVILDYFDGKLTFEALNSRMRGKSKLDGFEWKDRKSGIIKRIGGNYGKY